MDFSSVDDMRTMFCNTNIINVDLRNETFDKKVKQLYLGKNLDIFDNLTDINNIKCSKETLALMIKASN